MFQEGTSAVTFNSAFYLQSNPDVFQAIQNGTFQGNALQHFIQFGQFEGRDPNAFFDTEYYLAENTDVLVAIANPAIPSVTSAFQHFVMFGSDEGVVRAPSAAFESFNPDTYLAQNPDLQAAFGNLTGEAQDRALFAHFLEFGVNENRPGTGVDVDAGVPGQTVAFTAGVDQLVGSANNDTFTGVVGGTGATFQAGDSANGAGGTDRLNINAVADATVVGTTLTNIEQVYTRPIGTDTDVVLDAADWSGVNELWLDRATDAASSVTYDAVQDEAALGLSNTKGTLTANFAAGAFDSKDTLNVVTNNSTATVVATAAGTTFTGLSVTATGANVLTSAVAGTATTVTVDGQGSLEITNALAAATTVDASANSGGVDLSFVGNTGNVAVTGGAGDDRFDFTGADNLTVKDTVNGGAGFDTVVVTGANFSAPAAAAPFNALTGIERVEFVGGVTGTEVDVTLQGNTFTNGGITNLLFNNVGDVTILNAGSARTYEYGSTFEGDTTLQLKSAATTLNVDLLGDEGTNNLGADIGTLTVAYAAGTAATAVTTLNLDSLGDLDATTGVNNIDSISIRNGSTIVITGDADLDIGGLVATAPAAPAAGAVGSGLGFTIDASGFEADLTIASGADGDDFILSSTGDTRIELAAGSSGDLVAGGTAPVTPADIVNFDVVTGFNAGAEGDILDFTGTGGTFTATTATTQTSIDNNATTLAEAFTLATGTVVGWTAFEFGGEVYAAHNDGTAGFSSTADVIVQLAGIDVADLVGTVGGVQGNFA